MPAFAANNVARLLAGQRLALLNAEDLGNGAFTQAFFLAPSAGDGAPCITILNKTGQTVTLQASWEAADTTNFVPVTAGGVTAIAVPNGAAWNVPASLGLIYSCKAGAAITGGTLYVSR
jgi:hypothetical protein